jgi:hypothetical protein
MKKILAALSLMAVPLTMASAQQYKMQTPMPPGAAAVGAVAAGAYYAPRCGYYPYGPC